MIHLNLIHSETSIFHKLVQQVFSFSEISAEISGRKNCNETIVCCGRMRSLRENRSSRRACRRCGSGLVGDAPSRPSRILADSIQQSYIRCITTDPGNAGKLRRNPRKNRKNRPNRRKNRQNRPGCPRRSGKSSRISGTSRGKSGIISISFSSSSRCCSCWRFWREAACI